MILVHKRPDKSLKLLGDISLPDLVGDTVALPARREAMFVPWGCDLPEGAGMETKSFNIEIICAHGVRHESIIINDMGDVEKYFVGRLSR